MIQTKQAADMSDLLNSNIRCIEIEIMSLVAGAIAKLNSNIRCIEIRQSYKKWCKYGVE